MLAVSLCGQHGPSSLISPPKLSQNDTRRGLQQSPKASSGPNRLAAATPPASGATHFAFEFTHNLSLAKFAPVKRKRILPLCLLLAIAGGCAHLPPPSAGDVAKWEKAIAAFEASDRTNPPPCGAIVFVGSSSIRLWKTMEQDFPEHRVINRGFGGSQIADATAFASRIILPYQPRMVVLYAGDNDIAAGKPPEQVLADFRAFVRTLHRADPQLRVACIAIKPSLKRWNLVGQGRAANRRIADFCRKDSRLIFIDIATPMLGADGRPRQELFVEDGLHMTPAGYAIWRDAVRPHLR